MAAARRNGVAAMWVAGVAVIAAIVATYYLFDPVSAAYFPRCPFLTLTGFKCPGCGSQRALHALLHGEPAEAWRLNALLMAEIPLMALLCATWLMRRRYPGLRAALNSRSLILALLALIIIWTIARNIVQI